MSRRKAAPKRSILPDPKFGNLKVAKFMNQIMTDGKKSVATKVFDESLQLLISYIKDRNSIAAKNQENLYSLMNLTKDEIFMIALRKAQP